jgi:hypothetical protein
MEEDGGGGQGLLKRAVEPREEEKVGIYLLFGFLKKSVDMELIIFFIFFSGMCLQFSASCCSVPPRP